MVISTEKWIACENMLTIFKKKNRNLCLGKKRHNMNKNNNLFVVWKAIPSVMCVIYSDPILSSSWTYVDRKQSKKIESSWQAKDWISHGYLFASAGLVIKYSVLCLIRKNTTSTSRNLSPYYKLAKISLQAKIPPSSIFCTGGN